jgi:S1-C subfamily serine protease
MSDTTASSFGWTCPACQRRVPARIERCRCGHQHEAGQEVPAGDEPIAARPPARTRSLVEGLLLCLLVLGGGYYFTTARSAAAPQRMRATVASDVPRVIREPSNDTVVVSRPAERPPAAREPVTRSTSSDLPEPSAMPLEDVIERAMPGIVLIEATRTRGSGFLARPDLVVTNAHVIAGAATVNVTLQGGTKLAGTVVESSDDLDLALILIPRSSASDQPLPLGASSTLRLGQGIVALGWAQDLQQSPVTRGIVTGLRREGKQRLVQTDAVPNHGDSGGPVLDRRGEVVGVTTFRAEVSGAAAGFAVAIDDVKALLASTGR